MDTEITAKKQCDAHDEELATAALCRVGVILEQCAQLAQAVQRLAKDGGAKDDAAAHELLCIEQLAGVLGFQAEVGSRLCGNPARIGDAEEWLLPAEFFVTR